MTNNDCWLLPNSVWWSTCCTPPFPPLCISLITQEFWQCRVVRLWVSVFCCLLSVNLHKFALKRHESRKDVGTALLWESWIMLNVLSDVLHFPIFFFAQYLFIWWEERAKYLDKCISCPLPSPLLSSLDCCTPSYKATTCFPSFLAVKYHYHFSATFFFIWRNSGEREGQKLEPSEVKTKRSFFRAWGNPYLHGFL